MVLVTLDDLIETAEIIFTGRVSEVDSRWSSDGKTIYTYVTFADLRVVFGDASRSEITLRLEGGEIGDTKLLVLGQPTFYVGDQEFLFVAGNGDAISPVVGFFQGRFRIIDDEVYDYSGTPIVEIRDAAFVKLRSPAPSPQKPSTEAQISMGQPVQRTYSYGPNPNVLTEVMPQKEEILPPESDDPIWPEQPRNNRAVALPSMRDTVSVVTVGKTATIYLEEKADIGERLTVERFVEKIEARLERMSQ